MRPGQNRRMRGRNRKGPNPLTRSFESNGPDVKIRGTAQHIAEKYAQLSRDAQVSGDPVASENYLQHAEHYYRIVAAAQAQFQQTYGTFPRSFEDGEDGDGDDEGGFNGLPLGEPGGRGPYNNFNGQGGDEPYPQGAPQPAASNRQPYRERQERQERHSRGERPERPEGGERQEFSGEGRRDRRDRFRRDDNRGNVAETDDSAPDLPAFLTNPVRPSSAADEAGGAEQTDAPGLDEAEGGERFPVRTRRRRGRPRADANGADGQTPEPSAAAE